MKGTLLDTNVISELTKDRPDQNLVAFLIATDDLWIPIIVLHELDYGLNLLPPGKRRKELQATISDFVRKYDTRIIPLDRQEVKQAALLRVKMRQSGRVLHLGDALIAGMAKTHNLGLATRNIADFDNLGIELINPWDDNENNAL